MRRALFAAILVGSACAGFNIESAEGCASLCATARGCGFLPSMLGWDEDGDLDVAEEDCVRRCGNSPASDPTVAALVDCFAQGEAEPGLRWCEDASDADFVDWSPCAQIDRCLTREIPGHQLHSDVTLTVQMMSWTDYDARFVDATDAIADELQGAKALYPALDGIPGCVPDEACEQAGGDPGCGAQCRPTSCARALCSRAACKAIGCFDEDCTILVEEVPCDRTLCRVGEVSLSQTCAALGVAQISVSVREVGRAPVVQVFQDTRAEVNVHCEASTLQVVGENYQIRPGPVAVTATVQGELPGQALIDAGLRAPADVVDPTALEPYCLVFVGPPVVLRSGENTLVVPIEGLAELVAAGVDLKDLECPS